MHQAIHTELALHGYNIFTVMGMSGVVDVFAAVKVVKLVNVNMAFSVGSSARIVPIGVGDLPVSAPQAEFKKISASAPIKSGREILFISQVSLDQFITGVHICKFFLRELSRYLFAYVSQTKQPMKMLPQTSI